MSTGVRDQASAAFGSAAVPRPVGSSLMPLRRTPHRPDLARCLVQIAKRHACLGGLILCTPTPRLLQGPMACRSEV